MEKRIKKLRRHQTVNLIVGILFIVAAVCVEVLSATGILLPKDNSIFAAFVGGGAGALTSFFKIKKAFKSSGGIEDYLSTEYDERNITIKFYTAQSALEISAYIGLAVAIVFAYINKTVFLTLMASLCSVLIIMGLCKLYFQKKF